MTHWPLLSLVTFLPLVGAAFIMLARGDEHVVARNARNIALSTSLIVFALSLLLWIGFLLEHHRGSNSSSARIGFRSAASRSITTWESKASRCSSFCCQTMLTVLCIAASWTSVHHQVKEYMIFFLILETMMVGIFSALDFVLFYVFFESRAGPDVPDHRDVGRAAPHLRGLQDFFLYTLLGSVLSLLAILAVYFQTGSTDIAVALNHAFSAPICRNGCGWRFLPRSRSRCRCGRCTRVAGRPCRGADAEISMILAGVLLKMGGYGFIRFSLPMFPLASEYFTPLMFALSAIAVIYTSFVALVQTDMKKLIAYSSIAHMGFVTMGIFAATSEAVQRRDDPDAEPRLCLGGALPGRRRRL